MPPKKRARLRPRREATDSTRPTGFARSIDSNAQPPSLMKLPPELRLQIYHLVLVEPREIRNNGALQSASARTISTAPQVARILFPSDRNLGRRRALLRVSKRIRAEASPVYFRHNAFDFKILLDKGVIAKLALAFKGITKTCGPCAFGSIVFSFAHGSPNYDLNTLLPLVRLVHTTGLNLIPDQRRYNNAYLLDASLWARYCGPLAVDDDTDDDDDTDAVPVLPCVAQKTDRGLSYSLLDFAFVRLIKLGEQARDKRWTRARLEAEFNALVDELTF